MIAIPTPEPMRLGVTVKDPEPKVDANDMIIQLEEGS